MPTRAADTLKLTGLGRLLRLPLALMVVLTALAGALAAGRPLPGATLAALGWGVFLLAAACSVLNQVVERVSDALMRRTCRRPLASGALSPAAGTLIGLMLASGGVAVLAVGAGTPAALLGLAGLAWYLAVYTPLKRVSSLAVLAGTPCGALPPLIGWLAAGGPAAAPQALVLPLVMILWQVPHYWLLALPERDELLAAGFRALPAGVGDAGLLHLSHRWILGLCCASLLLPGLQLVRWLPLQVAIAALAALAAIGATWQMVRSPFPQITARRLRLGLHLWLALLLALLLLDQTLMLARF